MSKFRLTFIDDSKTFRVSCAQVGPTGKVVGIDHMSELVKAAMRSVNQDDPDLLEYGRLKFVGK